MAQTISGTVIKVHRGARDTWSAGIFRTDSGERIGFKANFKAIAGQALEVEGEYTYHETYGRQLSIQRAKLGVLRSPSGLAAILENDTTLEGVGKVRANKIAQGAASFAGTGGDLLEALAHNVEGIADLTGVDIALVRAAARISEANENAAAIGELCGLGWTPSQATRINERLGRNSMPVLEDDPYRLIETVKGFGFASVDKFVLEHGAMGRDDPRRMAAAVRELVDEQERKEGHTLVKLEEVRRNGKRILGPNSMAEAGRWESAVDEAIGTGRLRYLEVDGVEYVGTPETFADEVAVLDYFDRNMDASEDWGPTAVGVGAGLNAGQAAVLEAVRYYPITILTGLAGTGKTHTMREVLRQCDARGRDVALAAPTGKAARRLSESTGGRPASTVHRLLGVDLDGALGTTKLEADLLVIDEVSMADIHMLAQVIRSIQVGANGEPRTRLLLVGDPHQLPSVGAGSLLRDALEAHSYRQNVVELTEVVRQAGPLDRNSRAVLEGMVAPNLTGVWNNLLQRGGSENLVNDVADLFFACADVHGMDAVQVIVPQNVGAQGADAINREIKTRYQRSRGVVLPVDPKAKLGVHVGDRLIQTRNNYQLGPDGLMNGTMMTVCSVTRNGAEVIVRADGLEGELRLKPADLFDTRLAYACTVHKLQGSEVRHAIVVLSRSHTYMLSKPLIYTAVTRATESVTLIGDPVHAALKKDVNDERLTLGSIWEGARGAL